jgi:hypothetical protein
MTSFERLRIVDKHQNHHQATCSRRFDRPFRRKQPASLQEMIIEDSATSSSNDNCGTNPVAKFIHYQNRSHNVTKFSKRLSLKVLDDDANEKRRIHTAGCSKVLLMKRNSYSSIYDLKRLS